MWVPKPEEFCTHNAWKNALNDKSYRGRVRRYLHLEIRPNINSAIVDDESETVKLRMAIEQENRFYSCTEDGSGIVVPFLKTKIESSV